MEGKIQSAQKDIRFLCHRIVEILHKTSFCATISTRDQRKSPLKEPLDPLWQAGFVLPAIISRPRYLGSTPTASADFAAVNVEYHVHPKFAPQYRFVFPSRPDPCSS